LLTENFHLKRELAYEKKRYMDLMNAFLELRKQSNNRMSLSPLRPSTDDNLY
jgi:hypothetical protein